MGGATPLVVHGVEDHGDAGQSRDRTPPNGGAQAVNVEHVRLHPAEVTVQPEQSRDVELVAHANDVNTVLAGCFQAIGERRQAAQGGDADLIAIRRQPLLKPEHDALHAPVDEDGGEELDADRMAVAIERPGVVAKHRLPQSGRVGLVRATGMPRAWWYGDTM